MCGIFGFVSDNPSKENFDLLSDILALSAKRGTDATGLAIRKGKNIKIVKEAIDSFAFSDKYLKGLQKEISEANLVIGHTRAATMGSPKDNHNNHPVLSEKFVMVHNGMCPSMDRIKGYKYMGMVDSEILLSYIDTLGIEKGITKLKGSASIAVLPKKEPECVYLWRHSNPLWLGFDIAKKTLFFASTKDILEQGLANIMTIFSTFQMRELEEHWLAKLSFNPLNLEIIESIEPEKFVYVYRGGGASTLPYNHMGYGGMCGEEDWWENDKFNRKDVGDRKDHEDGKHKDRDEKVDKVLEAKITEVYDRIMTLFWNKDRKSYGRDIPEPDMRSRYYFDGQSIDYDKMNWTRLKGGMGHMSLDKKLLKLFDHEKKKHFLITVPKAVEQGLLRAEIRK